MIYINTAEWALLDDRCTLCTFFLLLIVPCTAFELWSFEGRDAHRAVRRLSCFLTQSWRVL